MHSPHSQVMAFVRVDIVIPAVMQHFRCIGEETDGVDKFTVAKLLTVYRKACLWHVKAVYH